jgi:hypothetical protein
MYEYEGFRRIVYDGGATFVPVCPECGRFVKADKTTTDLKLPNATCKKHGRVKMIFEGYY